MDVLKACVGLLKFVMELFLGIIAYGTIGITVVVCTFFFIVLVAIKFREQ